MCYIYKDNQKSAYIQNIYWVYADYIRQLSYERTFSVPSKRCEFFRFYLYLCHVLLRFTLVLICNTKISEKSDMAKS